LLLPELKRDSGVPARSGGGGGGGRGGGGRGSDGTASQMVGEEGRGGSGRESHIVSLRREKAGSAGGKNKERSNGQKALTERNVIFKARALITCLITNL
jgi:hypothetical protein